jgi:hypothetical protein
MDNGFASIDTNDSYVPLPVQVLVHNNPKVKVVAAKTGNSYSKTGAASFTSRGALGNFLKFSTNRFAKSFACVS